MDGILKWVIEKSLIKGLFAKVWAQCEETTRDSTWGWEQCGESIVTPSPGGEGRRGEEAILNLDSGEDHLGRAAWNNL